MWIKDEKVQVVCKNIGTITENFFMILKLGKEYKNLIN
jgi:hypothetical protein